MSLEELTPAQSKTKRKAKKSSEKSKPPTPLRADAVADYLSNNPNFFVNREHLLPGLAIPHETKGTISLVERQIEVLRVRNQELSQRLAELLENAKLNDSLFNKTRQLSLSLLQATDPSSCLDRLFRSLQADFSVGFARLIAFQPSIIDDMDSHRSSIEGNIESSMEGESEIEGDTQQGADYYRTMIPLEQAKQQLPKWHNHQGALCGTFSSNENLLLFGQRGVQVKSAAIIPLNTDAPIGIIALGSTDPSKFSKHVDTLFIDYIGEITTLALKRLLVM